MAENQLLADYAAGAPGNLQIPVPRVLQNLWNEAMKRNGAPLLPPIDQPVPQATPAAGAGNFDWNKTFGQGGGPVLQHGPSYVPSKSPEQQAAEADYAAGAPGNADFSALFRPVPGRKPMVTTQGSYSTMEAPVKQTTPFVVRPNDEPGFVSAAKDAGNFLWNIPSAAPNMGATVFNAVSGQWPGDRTVSGVVNAVGDFFTKSRGQAAADRMAPAVPTRLPPVPLDPTAEATGIDPKWTFASQLTGGRFSPAYFARTIGKEAGRNPDGSINNAAGNPNSTAVGPGQFVKGTFLALLKSHGETFGLTPQVMAQIPLSGKMKDGPLKTQLLALRKDPIAAVRATALLALENYDQLARPVNQGGLGRAPTESEVYLGHLLGPTAARNIIMAPPGAPVTAYVSRDAARANPTLFYKDGKPRTVSDFVGTQQTVWQGAGGGAGGGDLTFSTTMPAPPSMLPVQQTPKPVIAPMPMRPTPTAVDYGPVQANIDAGQVNNVLTPEDIKARQRSIVMSNMLAGLAKGFLPGMAAGYGRGKEAALAFEQDARQEVEAERAGYRRWATTPQGQVQEGTAANANNLADSLYQSAMDVWKVDGENADRRWDTENANAGALVGTQNQNAQNRWKWSTDVAGAGGVQNLGNGALMVSEGDPTTGRVTQRVVDASGYMAGLRRQGSVFGALSGANVPAETKSRLGALQVAASQGADAMWLVAADEIAASPLVDRILGGGVEQMRKAADTEASGDRRRAHDIFTAKIAAALALKAQQDPTGLRNDLAQANQLGIVTAGAILGYTGQ